MKRKIHKLFRILLSCILVLGCFPTAVSAATNDDTPKPFTFQVKKNVIKSGEAEPGEETFSFELEYGTVGENDHHMVVFTPDDSVTPEDCGIAFTNNTITTNGEGKQIFTLGGTIDPAKVDALHHWDDFTGNDQVPKQGIVLRLTEKNDGKAGWTYSEAERYLILTVQAGKISAEVALLGNDVYDNNFENAYSAYSFSVKKEDVEGNPLAGATFSLAGTGDFEGRVFNAVSGEDGIATFTVPEGNYLLFEKTAPDGYVNSSDAYAIAVRSDIDHTTLGWGGEAGVYVYNEDEPDGSNFKYVRYKQVTFVNEKLVIPEVTYQFTVKKTDAEGNPLAGATFSLTGTGNSVGRNFEAVSDTNGIAAFDVPEGFYMLGEKTAPAGYIKSDKTYGIALWNGTVNFYNEDAENDNDRYSVYQEVTFVNEKIVTAPKPTNPQKNTPLASKKTNPNTGDNSSILWVSLLFVSGLGIIGITASGKREKYSK